VWKEAGLSLPINMPDEYIDSTTYMLQYLLQMKGTNYTVQYCAEKIFGGLKLYKYFIRKRIKKGLTFPIPEGTDPTTVYDVDFILRPFRAKNWMDGIKDLGEEDKILTYDEVVAMDPRWRDSAELKRQIFGMRFSYSDSKFISLDNYINMMKYTEDLSILARVFIEHRENLEPIIMRYQTTGSYHSFYNIFIYFLLNLTFLMEYIETKAPDTLIKLSSKKLSGFTIPDNMDELRIRFIWYFQMHESCRPFIDNFPEAINDNTPFLELLIHIDKALGIAPMFHEILLECENFDEVYQLNQLFKIVREAQITPTSYDMVAGTIDGKSYYDYLAEKDEELAYQYQKNLLDESMTLITTEFDRCIQSIIEFIDGEYIIGYDTVERVKNVFEDSNTYIQGISKYLLYILKLFKAYSVDFITEDNIYEISADYNYQINIDQMEFDVDITKYDRWNVTQYDFVEVIKEFDDTLATDYQSNIDGVFIASDYGDLEITIF